MGCLLVVEVGHQPLIVQFSVQIFVLPFSNTSSLICSVAVKFDKLTLPVHFSIKFQVCLRNFSLGTSFETSIHSHPVNTTR